MFEMGWNIKMMIDVNFGQTLLSSVVRKNLGFYGKEYFTLEIRVYN